MSLTGKDIGKLRSLYESVYEPKEEETELMTEETFKDCLETVILDAIDQSGILDIEFEDEELQTRLIEEVISENIFKKIVTSKAGRDALTKLGNKALQVTGVSAGVGGVIDTAVKDDVSGKRNMGLKTTASFIKNLPKNLRSTYTTVQAGAKDTGNKVVDITGTGLTQNKDIRKSTDPKGNVLTTTNELIKDRRKILDQIRNQRNKDK